MITSFLIRNLAPIQRKQSRYFVKSRTEQYAGNMHNHSACAGRTGAWGQSLPTSFLHNLADLHCLLLFSGAVFRRAWNRVPEKKRFHFVKTFGPGTPVKSSLQEIGKTQKRHGSLMPQRFPKFSKRENDFGSHVIWCQRKPKSWELPL